MGMRVGIVAMGLAVVASASIAQQPASAPAPAMLFFDWGKPDIRSDDQATLDKVAETYRGRTGARLMIAGHSDRSGSRMANRAAALKRAETVREELEKRGIPRNAMSIASFGEDRPLVPTEDGVREVQNRRVVIAFEE